MPSRRADYKIDRYGSFLSRMHAIFHRFSAFLNSLYVYVK
jgi:hypothetical protein